MNTPLVQVNLSVTPEQLNQMLEGVYIDRGGYNASSNEFPKCGGSGTNGSIKRANTWDITDHGTLGGEAVKPGDVIRARIDNPGQERANWVITSQSTFE